MKKQVLMSLFLLILSVSVAFAQGRSVSGQVMDSKTGEPVPAVSVFVKGTTTGTVTDVNGKFTLTVPGDDAVLVFQSVGMVSQEVAVGSQTNLSISMVTDTRELGEVVVTGTGEATDTRKLGISVEAVKADEFNELPSASVDQALIGKVPGAFIQSVSGQPGQQQNIILRAVNSVSGNGNQPMIMIDGVQINTDNNFNGSANNLSSRLADLDLSDVERVEVVQGAAAATIYGAQGANGVIQIFTKKGKAGQTRINVKSSVATNQVLRGNLEFSDLHYFNTDADGFILDGSGNRMAFNPTSGFYPDPNGDGNANAVDFFVDKPYRETIYDQLDQVFQTATTWNNSVSVSGGGETATYSAFLSNMNQESVIFGDLDRINARLNVSAELFKNFKVNLGTSYITSNNTTGGITGQDNINSPLGTAMLTRRYINMDTRDQDGNLIGRLESDNSVNPLFSNETVLHNADVNRLIQNVGFNYKPFKFLELDYKYGYDAYRYDFTRTIVNQEDFLRPGRDPFEGSILNLADEGSTQNSLLSAFFRFNFAEDFGSNLPLTSTTHLAYDWRKTLFNRITSQVTGIPASPNINLNQGADPLVSQFEDEFVTFGFLVNQKFEYNNFLGISGGVRVDWSSAFGEGSDPFIFPRGDIFLRLSELAFWEGLKNTIPEFKVRAAYGEAGIQPGAFDRIQTFQAGTIGNDAFLFSPSQLSNPGLDVQVSKELETGFDFGLAPGKESWFPYIGVGFTYWTRTTEDVIRFINVSPSTGASEFLTNALDLSANGIQFSINTVVFEDDKWNWGLTTNFSRGITVVDRIEGGQPIIIGGSGSGGFVLREGDQVGTMYGFQALTSIDQTRSDGTRYIEAADAGDYEIVNGLVVNKASQSVLFTDEQEALGNATPDFNMSFINTLSYKDMLTFSFQLDWIQGMDVYNQTRQWMYRDLIHGDVTEPVTIDGTTGAFTRFYTSQYNTNQPNDQFVEDASFLRLRNISLGFDFAKAFEIPWTKQLRLTLSANNLFTITDYKGLDPEAASNINDPAQRGLDNYAFPNFRTYSATLNLGF